MSAKMEEPDDMGWGKKVKLTAEEEKFLKNLIAKEEAKNNSYITKATNMILQTFKHYYEEGKTYILFALNEKLLKDVEFTRKIEEELQNLEKEVSDELHEDYIVRFVMPEGEINVESIKDFLFGEQGKDVLEKIHKHYVVHYYLLMHGQQNKIDQFELNYEDSVIPLKIGSDMSADDEEKFETFKYNAMAYFVQALCTDEAKGGFDLMINGFHNMTGASRRTIRDNDAIIDSLIEQHCIESEKPSGIKRPKYVVKGELKSSPEESEIIKRIKKSKKPTKTVGKKGGSKKKKTQKRCIIKRRK